MSYHGELLLISLILSTCENHTDSALKQIYDKDFCYETDFP